MIATTDIDLRQLLGDWYGSEPRADLPLPAELDWLPEDLRNALAGVSRPRVPVVVDWAIFPDEPA